MEQIIESMDIPRITTAVLGYIPRVGAALALLVFFYFLFRVTRIALKAAMKRGELHEKVVELLVDKLYKYVMMIFAMVMAADQLGVNVGAALAGLGVAGIAVGFAAQDSVANVISGILIFWDKPFHVGDWIQTEGHYGCVSNITLRSTRIRTPRNTYVVIPNKRIIDEVLENHSKHGDLRVDVPLGIAYKESIPAAREVLLGAVRSMRGVDFSRDPEVVVEELGGSSVNLQVRVWIHEAAEMQKAHFGAMEACKLALDAAGIQIPYPHLQLFVDEVKPPVWKDAARLLASGGGEAA